MDSGLPLHALPYLTPPQKKKPKQTCNLRWEVKKLVIILKLATTLIDIHIVLNIINKKYLGLRCVIFN